MNAAVLVGAAAASAALLLVAPAYGQDPVGDSVKTGGDGAGGHTGLFMQVSAEAGPNGENPSGQVLLHGGGGLGPSWRGSVSCLAVFSNLATLGFAGTHYEAGYQRPTAGL